MVRPPGSGHFRHASMAPNLGLGQSCGRIGEQGEQGEEIVRMLLTGLAALGLPIRMGCWEGRKGSSAS